MTAGIDEVGRGPLAGPVIASAVILPDDHDIGGLNDSKKLSPKKRSILYNQIMNKSIDIGIGCVGSDIIDKINIRNATIKAMEKAVENLTSNPDNILIDGLDKPNLLFPFENIVKGDTKIECIMAASIIAKVTRDRIMENYSIIFSEYGFEKNKGYGTKFHMEALKINMATPIHRKSFNPVSKYLPTFRWIRENNKMRWMANRLCCIYLMNKNYKIKDLEISNDNNTAIDIIGEFNNLRVFIFINILNDSEYVKNPNSKSIDISNIKEYVSKYLKSNDIDIDIKWRADTINVNLYNKNSQFEHLEGILTSN